MEYEKLISLKKFCIHYKVKESIVLSLDEFGLITIHKIDQEYFLNTDDIVELEKMLRLHCDLGINLEGIDAIIVLLKQNKVLRHKLWLAEKNIAFFSSKEEE